MSSLSGYKFTSLSQLAPEDINPPKTENGVIVPNPYKNYQLVENLQRKPVNFLQFLLKRYRVTTNSTLCDTTERYVFDTIMATVVAAILFALIRSLFG